MKITSPLVRMSLGLVLVTCSMLILLDLTGLLPQPADERMAARVRTCESLAAQAAAGAGDRSLRSIRAALRSAVERDPDVLSAALRDASGKVFAGAGDHATHWNPDPAERSAATHIEIPLMRSGRLWAKLEVRFADDASRGILQAAWSRPLVRIVLLMGGLGFVSYLIYLRRTLRHLDPSAVIPARVQAALDVMAEGVLLVDQNDRIVLANAAFVERFGSSAADLMGRKAAQLGWKRPDAPGTAIELPWLQAMESGQANSATLFLEARSGERRSLIVRGSPVLDGWDRPKGAIATFDDVTELELKTEALEQALADLQKSQEEIGRKNEELQFLAHHDPLTGASNRRFFLERFSGQLDPGRKVCCVMADIDLFKKVNDRHGHQVGDEVIRRVSEALVSEVRSDDNVCRYGGEEFCLILQDTDLAGAAAAAERVRRRIDSPGFARVPVTVSFGVASIASGASSLTELIEQADRALYASKANGRNRVTRWDELESPPA